MSIVIPDCTSCKNLTDKNEKGQFCCKAFPYGIPKDYFWGKVDVRNIQQCANNIRFEKEEF